MNRSRVILWRCFLLEWVSSWTCELNLLIIMKRFRRWQMTVFKAGDKSNEGHVGATLVFSMLNRICRWRGLINSDGYHDHDFIAAATISCYDGLLVAIAQVIASIDAALLHFNRFCCPVWRSPAYQFTTNIFPCLFCTCPPLTSSSFSFWFNK